MPCGNGQALRCIPAFRICETARTNIDQQRGGLPVTVLGGQHERRPAILHTRIDRRPVIGQRIDDLGLSDQRSHEQRGIEILPMIRRKFLDGFLATVCHRQHKCDETVVVFRLRIRALPEQPLHHFRAIRHHRRHQRGTPLRALGINCKTLVQEKLSRLLGAHCRRNMHRPIPFCILRLHIEAPLRHFSQHRDIIVSNRTEPPLRRHRITSLTDFLPHRLRFLPAV